MKPSVHGNLLALDLGATKFAYCLSGGESARAVTHVEFPRLADADREFDVIADALTRDRVEYSGVPVLCAAPNLSDGIVQCWPNRPYWQGFALLPAMESVLGVRPVAIGDGEAAAVADAGDEPGVHYLSLMLGTGVGGGVVRDGRIVRFGSLSSEFGHIVTDPRGRRCSCGVRGCFQSAWVAFRENTCGSEEFVVELSGLLRILGRVFPACTVTLGGRYFAEDHARALALAGAVRQELDGDVLAPRLRVSRTCAIGPLLGGLIVAGQLGRQQQSEG